MSYSPNGTTARCPADPDSNSCAGPKLAEVKKFKGFDDPKTSLQEALDGLMRGSDLTIEVNRKAFGAADVKDVTDIRIVESNPIPEFTSSLALMLRKILDRLPTGEGTFIIRDGVIEITTLSAVKHEFFRERPAIGALPPLVHAAIINVPLTKAVRDLARSHGGNVVVDVRAVKEAGTMVTAEFSNVPLDTAVSLLADMADLMAVEVGNVIYVTTKENGRALQLKQEQRRLKGLEKPDVTK